jgi:hypothetical protein
MGRNFVLGFLSRHFISYCNLIPIPVAAWKKLHRYLGGQNRVGAVSLSLCPMLEVRTASAFGVAAYKNFKKQRPTPGYYY